VLDVFGGKITTYRRLAEAALGKLRPNFPGMGSPWTAGVALPGGDFPHDGVAAQAPGLRREHPFLDEGWAGRLVRGDGTDAARMLEGVRGVDDMGERFGSDLTEREVRWMREREWARTADDVLWRRSKLGLRLSPAEAGRLAGWMDGAAAEAAPAAIGNETAEPATRAAMPGFHSS
jgi:glycerol-3-phosphate dehydrogenase